MRSPGVFTYALLQGLRGAAQNRDGEVTVPDLIATWRRSAAAHPEKVGL